MHATALILGLTAAANAAVVSHDWREGKLALKLDEGGAEIEWISQSSIRFARNWSTPAQKPPTIPHERIDAKLEDTPRMFTMRSRYITVELDRADLKWRVRTGETRVASGSFAKTAAGVELRLEMAPGDKAFGLMGGPSGRLNVRGEKLEREHGFFFSSNGYGLFVRSPGRHVFDMTSGTIEGQGGGAIEFAFYYGPSPKEILEQHLIVMGSREVTGDLEDRPPKAGTALPKVRIDSWESLRGLVQTLNQWSLSAVLYPAFDLASMDGAPDDVKQRALDLAAMLPIVYRSSGQGGLDREAWKPYLATYLREANDRGIPLIRPIPMQFSKDANSDQQTDVFMLGDEVLLAPVLGPGGRRRVELPRGSWTDLRTNAEYRGNQAVEVDAPAGRVPVFVRNGWIVPLAAGARMELHYFPSLAAEFFLWEPQENENSQFHAAPAGEFVRVEIESKVRRTYEWILHHTKAPRTVAEESGAYEKVAERAQLRPGTWWHDVSGNNLHILVQAEADSDRIVNISF